jgi:hypothetical protein
MASSQKLSFKEKQLRALDAIEQDRKRAAEVRSGLGCVRLCVFLWSDTLPQGTSGNAAKRPAPARETSPCLLIRNVCEWDAWQRV